jgi:hypothetical protein
MLLLAGFPAPTPLELPFAERVREALRLRGDGRRWGEIGELLGISPDTARRYTRAHDCEGCCEPVLRAGASRCRRCSTRGRTRWGHAFQRPEIVAAIQAWERFEGRAPAIVDWRPAEQGGHPRWERECPRYPPRSHVIRTFGSWNAALQAAGFDRPRPPAYTDQQILNAVRTHAREHGRAPLASEWDASPDRNIISQRFGSWNAALQTAGLSPRRIRRAWSDEEILEGLRQFADHYGRPPRSTDRVGPLAHYPSPALAVTRFGSWSAALRRAGLEPGNPPPVTKRQIATALREFSDRHGRSPTSSEWQHARLTPATNTITRHCGSWHAALALAGLQPPTPRKRADVETPRHQRTRGNCQMLWIWR